MGTKRSQFEVERSNKCLQTPSSQEDGNTVSVAQTSPVTASVYVTVYDDAEPSLSPAMTNEAYIRSTFRP